MHSMLPPTRAVNVSPQLRNAIIIVLCVLFAIKTFAAVTMGLFGDEAFYYQCAQRLSICYVDHPFMTALLVRAGVALGGHTTVGVRLLFLVFGLVIHLGIFMLARPLVGSRDAWLAMGASLLITPIGLFSALAIPDVPLLAFSVLGLAVFERATRCGGALLWISAGLLAALGLCTHYRFVPFVLAVLLYLIGTKHGRACFKRPGPWIGMAVLCCGFIPLIVYNVRLHWEPLYFQFVGRHGGGFQPLELLRHPLEQMVTVSPLLYVALIVVLIALWQKAYNSDHRSALLAIFASTFLGGYFLLSPWSDNSHNHMHWPLPGYLPLLILLPETLRKFIQYKPTSLRRIAAVMVPGIGGILTVLVIIELSWGLFDVGFLKNSFTGWAECGHNASDYLLATCQTEANADIIVGDNYILAAQLEFYLPAGTTVYTLDHKRTISHGRSRQYRQWRADEQELRRQQGKNALVVVEITATSKRKRNLWLNYISSFFRRFYFLNHLEIPMTGGKTRLFYFYRGIDLNKPDTEEPESSVIAASHVIVSEPGTFFSPAPVVLIPVPIIIKGCKHP